jgi:predicted amidohydrolase YtcJ
MQRKATTNDMKPSLALINSNVITVQDDMPKAQAVLVGGNRILSVGSSNEIKKEAGNACIIDLEGKTLIPGLIEPHGHFSDWAVCRFLEARVDLSRSIDEAKEAVLKKKKDLPVGSWIRGYGFDHTKCREHQHLTRYDLDEAAPNQPVFIFHNSGHCGYANSQALKIAGIDKNTPQPRDGVIEHDEKGEPTGVLLEPGATDLVVGKIPPYDTTQNKIAFKKGFDALLKKGICASHDAAVGWGKNCAQIMAGYHELEQENDLWGRVYLTIMEYDFRKLTEKGIGTGFGSDKLRLGGVKFIQDGSYMVQTAVLTQGYHAVSGENAKLLIEQDLLNEQTFWHHSRGNQLAIHAAGDGAIDSALIAIENCMSRKPKDLRHHIIHAQTARVDQLRRFKELGIVANFYMSHIWHWGDAHYDLYLGPERSQGLNPVGDAQRLGVHYVLHTDFPVVEPEPFKSIYCATERKTPQGRVLGVKQKISRLQALRAWTLTGAYSSFEEQTRGSIKSGKLADLVILDRDMLTVSGEDLLETKVLGTVFDGQFLNFTENQLKVCPTK